MAEFKKVMKQLQAERTENVVMQWAAENPEPIYPTWAEWLKEQGLAKRECVLITEYGPNTINQANKDVDILVVNAYKPIPADIAQKLGIEPKEGV